MKKDGKYRFSLQFRADTDENIQAGELLERLANKKSSVVIAALNEYMAAHPELQTENGKVEVKISSGYDRNKLEKLIGEIVKEKLTTEGIMNGTKEQQEVIDGFSENNIAQMLGNLDLFRVNSN